MELTIILKRERGLNEHVLALSCDTWNSREQNLDSWMEVEDRVSQTQYDGSVRYFCKEETQTTFFHWCLVEGYSEKTS